MKNLSGFLNLSAVGVGDVRDVFNVVEVVVTGYYSSSRRAAQTPCEDIQIRFPLPEPWIYLFRVERRFKYGSVHSATRKPGRIKGLERLTQFAQGILPPSLIEVSAGLAKYEHVFKAIVWRIDQLPERNEGIMRRLKCFAYLLTNADR